MTITINPAVIAMAVTALFWLLVLVCTLRSPRRRTAWRPPEGFMRDPSTSQCTHL
jgi:hypothetical protein